MRFKDFYFEESQETGSSFLVNEGGNAFHNTTAIPQSNIPNTLKDLQVEVLDKIGLTQRGNDWELLGSAMKKEDHSGDIDVAINVLSLFEKFPDELNSLDQVFDFLQKKLSDLKYDTKAMKGFNIFSIAFPINGLKDQYVQIDLMPTDNMDLIKWSYWSPKSTESRFKKMGLYRNILMSAIATEINRKVLSNFPDGDVKEMEKFAMSLEKGLIKKVDSWEGKKGKLTNPRDIKELKSVISNVPEEIVKILLGPTATIEDTNSFESIYNKIMSKDFPYKDKINDIKAKAKDSYENLKLPVPEELS
jgi:hypothetical protein